MMTATNAVNIEDPLGLSIQSYCRNMADSAKKALRQGKGTQSVMNDLFLAIYTRKKHNYDYYIPFFQYTPKLFILDL